MKLLMILGGLLALALALTWYLHLRSHNAPAGPVAHVDNSFEFTVQGEFREVVPLFGAWGERAWAEGWNPKFLHPAPARDIEGEVFTVSHGHRQAVWVNTALDFNAGRMQYVYLIPGAQVAVIDVNATPASQSQTDVKVRYRRTALDSALNAHIIEQGRQDAQSGPEWAAAIDACLKSKAHN